VWHYAADHGLQPDFDCSGGRVLIPGLHRRSDDDRSLAWLAAQVIPVIGRLQAHGYGAELEELLGRAGRGNPVVPTPVANAGT
jgi:hypothetical protein